MPELDPLEDATRTTKVVIGILFLVGFLGIGYHIFFSPEKPVVTPPEDIIYIYNCNGLCTQNLEDCYKQPTTVHYLDPDFGSD